ncbi:hypothetical protein J3458_000006 [Metarhizium acridum]|uniref:uncharacterized protein n=1 Tax=Metarhizium acridum TaxID=92637 RepID=UPI001C6B93E6|nr:hypothetical protein J3458_000006 [Metarhizium acridum]
MSIALQGDLEFILAPSDTLPAVSRLDTVDPSCKSWVYNNWGYSVAGSVIEKLSGKPAYQYIRETILDQPGLANTTTRPILDQDSDFAEAYSALENAPSPPESQRKLV